MGIEFCDNLCYFGKKWSSRDSRLVRNAGRVKIKWFREWDMNIKEVAKLAGVSVASVSRAFQNPPSPSVSPKQRERILRICEELHYYPDIHSRRMSRKCSNNITLLSRHISSNDRIEGRDLHFDYNFAAITMGVQHVLSQFGKSLQLVYLTDRFLEERQHLTMVRSKMTDGILLWGAWQNDRFVQELIDEKIPLVLLNTTVADCDCAKVVADEYGGMKMVAEAAMEAGHRRIAVLPPGTTGSSGVERERAIRDAFREHGLEPAWVAPGGGFDYAYGREMGLLLLQSGIEASCVIAPNDMAAWGCVAALHESGIRVPEDISVTGADGLGFPCTLCLASFYLPSYEIGVEGARLLTGLIAGDEVERTRILPVSRIAGNSIRQLAP